MPVTQHYNDDLLNLSPEHMRSFYSVVPSSELDDLVEEEAEVEGGLFDTEYINWPSGSRTDDSSSTNVPPSSTNNPLGKEITKAVTLGIYDAMVGNAAFKFITREGKKYPVITVSVNGEQKAYLLSEDMLRKWYKDFYVPKIQNNVTFDILSPQHSACLERHAPPGVLASTLEQLQKASSRRLNLSPYRITVTREDNEGNEIQEKEIADVSLGKAQKNRETYAYVPYYSLFNPQGTAQNYIDQIRQNYASGKFFVESNTDATGRIIFPLKDKVNNKSLCLTFSPEEFMIFCQQHGINPRNQIAPDNNITQAKNAVNEIHLLIDIALNPEMPEAALQSLTDTVYELGFELFQNYHKLANSQGNNDIHKQFRQDVALARILLQKVSMLNDEEKEKLAHLYGNDFAQAAENNRSFLTYLDQIKQIVNLHEAGIFRSMPLPHDRDPAIPYKRDLLQLNDHLNPSEEDHIYPYFQRDSLGLSCLTLLRDVLPDLHKFSAEVYREKQAFIKRSFKPEGTTLKVAADLREAKIKTLRFISLLKSNTVEVYRNKENKIFLCVPSKNESGYALIGPQTLRAWYQSLSPELKAQLPRDIHAQFELYKDPYEKGFIQAIFDVCQPDITTVRSPDAPEPAPRASRSEERAIRKQAERASEEILKEKNAVTSATACIFNERDIQDKIEEETATFTNENPHVTPTPLAGITLPDEGIQDRPGELIMPIIAGQPSPPPGRLMISKTCVSVEGKKATDPVTTQAAAALVKTTNTAFAVVSNNHNNISAIRLMFKSLLDQDIIPVLELHKPYPADISQYKPEALLAKLNADHAATVALGAPAERAKYTEKLAELLAIGAPANGEPSEHQKKYGRLTGINPTPTLAQRLGFGSASP